MKIKKRILVIALLFELCGIVLLTFGQKKADVTEKGPPFVNQSGYNLGEAKRFTVPGAPDGTKFQIVRLRESAPSTEVLYTGTVKDYVGYFTDFNPISAKDEYVIEVPGFGQSYPFWIADHLMEKLSSRLAYQFFIDVRGGFTPRLSPANVTGGGPSRDGGGQGLEATFEGLLCVTVLETGTNTGLFTADFKPADFTEKDRTPTKITAAYGHLGFEKSAALAITGAARPR